MTRSFLFLLASARPDGNTEQLARTAAEQLPSDTEQRWLDLAQLPLPDYVDARHADAPWPEQENEELLRQATLTATDIVIASPLYWYSLSSYAKRYFDYWSKWLSTPDPGFRTKMAGRTLWGVTAMAHREEIVAEPLVLTLHHTAAYMGMRFGGVLLGNGSRPGQVLDDKRAAIRAKTFFAEEAPFARFPYEEE
ncbi:multimeric flavodoxin WrbA [Streptomyces sp. 3211.6]|uniref:flavodoxin family protein n=1 Tax=Streptomyces TaxID=1883 RepID=UPI0009A4B94E|nr:MULTISPECIES: NAD(P)H-dependent oxidoreductase [Streptomyces]RKT02328.1 multimeric flavodoxin WrbA [Streptomyces sp. 3211.6]RPF43647.1 multimeric flavodoxin WrbA [Streptomyces sp. Ag109_G2-6]